MTTALIQRLQLQTRPGNKADHSSVHVAPPRHGVQLGDDDEGRLLQEGDSHGELLRDTLGGHVAVVRPDNILDIQSSLSAPTTNLWDISTLYYTISERYHSLYCQ